NRLHRHFDVAADFRVLGDVEGILEPQLAIGKLELRRIVREYLPASPRIVVAGLAIDGDAHVNAFAMTLTRGGSKRGLERFENDLLVDAFLVGNRVHDHQNLFVHRANSASSSIYICGATRALCISSIGRVTLPPSIFNAISRSLASIN